MRPSENLDNRPCKVLIFKGILGGRGRKERFNQKGLKVDHFSRRSEQMSEREV
jgi:hypothetical protein